MRFDFRIVPVVAALATLQACGGEAPQVSNIADDEIVQFIRSTAWLDEANAVWNVAIHGWIFEPEESAVRKALFAEILESQFDLEITDATRPNFERRLNLLIADNERDKEIIIDIGGRHFILEPSAENGHFRSTVYIRAEEVELLTDDGDLTYAAVTRADDPRQFVGSVRLVGPQGLSVISDIDDTVKISHVIDRKKLIEQTFLLDFEAVPGMAELYSDWVSQGASLHFVSSSPWQLYEPLAEFLHDSGFPPSTLNLKAVRFRDETLFDLFRKGTDTKPAIIEEILGQFPGRRFILVGDSGEQDPEVYAGMLRSHPAQVLKVYIRNVTGETSDNERFMSVFDGIDRNRWMLFDDPASVDRNIQ